MAEKKMSWLRSALNKAAEVGSKNNLSRTVRNYAGAVYNQAAGSAKIVQDRLSGRNLNSFKDAVRRLNDVSLNARGAQRLQALARWLAALKEIDQEIKKPGNADSNPASPKNSDTVEDGASSPRKTYMTLFYDFDNKGEAMNFRDVFLESRALEHIVTSMILEAPQDEEIGLLSEIFGLCLAGGEELHKAFISSIQDLSKAFSSLSEEIQIKRSDLIELAQTAVTGLKLSAVTERLDAEIHFLQQKLAETQGVVVSKESSNSIEDANLTEEIVEYGARIRSCLHRKEELLSKGDTATSRTEKIEKLKEVTKGLENSISEMERKASENRQQMEKALKYRDTKFSEVLETEKALASEVQVLQKRKEELEAELKQVNTALAAATARHINIQEEKEQFDEATSNIVAHLSSQEVELSGNVSAQKAESIAASTWLSFLEDTWLLQSSCVEEKTKDIKHDLQEAKQQFLSIASMNLSYHQEEMKLLLKQLKLLSEQMKPASEHDRSEDGINNNNNVHERYLDTEKKAIGVLEIMCGLCEEVKAFGLRLDGDDVEKKLIKILESVNLLNEEFREIKKGQSEESSTVTSVDHGSEERSTVSSVDYVNDNGSEQAEG